MPRMEMLYGYTIEAAKALMLDKKIGSLHRGRYADMILLDGNVPGSSGEEMQATRAFWTMFERNVVYNMSKSKSF